MGNAALAILMRYVHIVSAILAVGGMAFISLCFTPALRVVDEGFRAALMQRVQGRFLRVVWASIAGLTISGVYNWIMLAGTYRAMGPVGNALIGTKVLLAAVIFGVVFARSVGLIRPTRFWHLFNLHLAAVVILLAAVLRYYRLEYLHTLIR